MNSKKEVIDVPIRTSQEAYDIIRHCLGVSQYETCWSVKRGWLKKLKKNKPNTKLRIYLDTVAYPEETTKIKNKLALTKLKK